MFTFVDALPYVYFCRVFARYSVKSIGLRQSPIFVVKGFDVSLPTLRSERRVAPCTPRRIAKRT